MGNTFHQYKISDMIKALQTQQDKHGDLLVDMSIDEEGNGFHPIGAYISETKTTKEVMVPFGIDVNKLTIYPCQE